MSSQPVQAQAVDPKTFRKGDRVWVETTIAREGPDPSGIWTVEGGPGWVAYIPADRIIRHFPQPRPIEVGNRVKWSGYPAYYTVLAVDGDFAWISQPNNDPRLTVRLSDLEWVDP